MATKLEVSIIQVNYGCSKLIERCLDSVERHTSLDWEAIVVDNFAPDPNLENLELRKNVRVVRAGTNLGFGKACNLGVESAMAEFVILLNPDIVLEQPALDGLVERLRSVAAPAMTAPRLRYGNGTVQASWNVAETLAWEFARNHYLQRIWYGRLQRKYEGELSSPWVVGEVVGACMAMRTKDYRSLGGFDPDFFMNGEDGEFCDRVREKIGRIEILPWIEVRHFEGEVQTRDMARYMKHRFEALHLANKKRYRGWRRFVAQALWWEGILLRYAIGAIIFRGLDRTRLPGMRQAMIRVWQGKLPS